MSTMIKALSRQIDARLPVSGPTLVVVILWATAFAAFTVLGLRF